MFPSSSFLSELSVESDQMAFMCPNVPVLFVLVTTKASVAAFLLKYIANFSQIFRNSAKEDLHLYISFILRLSCEY